MYKFEEVKNKMFTDSFLFPEDENVKRISKNSKKLDNEITYWRRLPDQPVRKILFK